MGILDIGYKGCLSGLLVIPKAEAFYIFQGINEISAMHGIFIAI